jgi:rhodanese-related sulfurtransferase
MSDINSVRVRIARSVLAGLLVLGASAASADGAGPSIHQATLAEANQDTAEVSEGELRNILAAHSALVLDTRSHAEFVAGHIPGARNLAVAPSQVAAAVERLANGDKGQPIVLYCNGPFCQASRRTGSALVAAGFTNVRRFQLGMPIWRALGGPTEVELEGIVRVSGRDRTAVFVDARAEELFARGTVPGARNLPVAQYASGALKKAPLPEDDFNTRIVLFGEDATQARALAEALSKRPWHNVMYFPGSYEELRSALTKQ